MPVIKVHVTQHTFPRPLHCPKSRAHTVVLTENMVTLKRTHIVTVFTLFTKQVETPKNRPSNSRAITPAIVKIPRHPPPSSTKGKVIVSLTRIARTISITSFTTLSEQLQSSLVRSSPLVDTLQLFALGPIRLRTIVPLGVTKLMADTLMAKQSLKVQCLQTLSATNLFALGKQSKTPNLRGGQQA